MHTARGDESVFISKRLMKERTFLTGKLSVFNNNRKAVMENLSHLEALCWTVQIQCQGWSC